MTNLQLWISVAIGAFLLILIIYLFCAIFQRKSIIVSSAADTTKPVISADQIYYLPTASILVTATAKVAANLNSEGHLQSAALSSLTLENKVVVEADTTKLYQLEYTPSLFAHDEVRMTTNTEGLLESVTSTAEDRLPAIITELSKAPKSILSDNLITSKAARLDIVTVKMLEFTRTFIIRPDELESSPITKRWSIPVEGLQNRSITADASFTITFTPQETKHINDHLPIRGLLTRPLTKLTLEVTATDVEPATYDIIIPDRETIVNLPITRSAFVNKLQTPRLKNGLVTENFIDKPSEAEGFVSVPVNILKAIFSIPAQLLSFRIFHLQKETELETAKQQLAEARKISSQQEEIQKKINTAADDLKKSSTQLQQTAKDVANEINDIKKEPASTPIADEIFIEAITNNQESWKKEYGALDISLGKKRTNGIDTDINAIIFKPLKKLEPGQVAFELIPPFIEFEASDGRSYLLPTDVQQTGGEILAAFTSFPNEGCDVNNPKRPGCSVSPADDDATGTIGLKVFRNGRSFILSCYHVLCASQLKKPNLEFNSNNSAIRIGVISPGFKDHGTLDNLLATVTEGKLTEFFDCAIAELRDDLDVKLRICRIDQEPSGTLTIGSKHLKPRLQVFMSGRTSKLNSAFIKSSFTSTDIKYSFGIKTLNGLIATTPLAMEGDSGALVFDEDCRIIGIVVARSPSDTYIIPIEPILTEFKIKLQP